MDWLQLIEIFLSVIAVPLASFFWNLFSKKISTDIENRALKTEIEIHKNQDEMNRRFDNIEHLLEENIKSTNEKIEESNRNIYLVLDYYSKHPDTCNGNLLRNIVYSTTKPGEQRNYVIDSIQKDAQNNIQDMIDGTSAKKI